MRTNNDAAETLRKYAAHAGVVLMAAMMLSALPCAVSAMAQDNGAESKPAERKGEPEAYQTIYLTNLTQQGDASEVTTALRNMLPRTRIYYVQSQGAITMEGSPGEIEKAKNIVADLDKVRKIYRVTYTITDMDGDRETGSHHFSLVVASGDKTSLKQGFRVPIVTGMYDAEKSTANSQVQYQDVGLNIEASLSSYLDGLKLRSKIEQTSVVDDKSGVGPQDPMVRQAVLDGTATLTQGKALTLGSFDVPGSARRQTIEVVAELVK